MVTFVGRLGRRRDVGMIIIIIHLHRCCWMFMGGNVVGSVVVGNVIRRDV